MNKIAAGISIGAVAASTVAAGVRYATEDEKGRERFVKALPDLAVGVAASAVIGGAVGWMAGNTTSKFFVSGGYTGQAMAPRPVGELIAFIRSAQVSGTVLGASLLGSSLMGVAAGATYD